MTYEILPNIMSFYSQMLLFKLFSCCPYLDFSQNQKKIITQSSDKFLTWIQEHKALLFILLLLSLFYLPFSSKRCFWLLNSNESQHFSPRNLLPKTTLACAIVSLHANNMLCALPSWTTAPCNPNWLQRPSLGHKRVPFLWLSLSCYLNSPGAQMKNTHQSHLSIQIWKHYLCIRLLKSLLSIMSNSESKNLFLWDILFPPFIFQYEQVNFGVHFQIVQSA